MAARYLELTWRPLWRARPHSPTGSTAWGWTSLFSSRRRHTRLSCDWSSDVCSSDLSEEVVARALEGRSNRPYVFTKCERRWDANRQIYKSLKADSIREECEGSLRRLKVDVIDYYQIHWPEPDEDIEEGWTAMAKLKQEGKVRWIGLSNFNAKQLERVRRIAPITSLQPPYSAVSPEIEDELLPYC